MKTSIVNITPKYAEELISRNINNRHHNSNRSKNFAKAMERGEWAENGDAIRISKTGRLLDGQHRLWAIIYSGISQKYIIASDLDDEVFDTIDRGAGRTVGDIFYMSGEKHYNSLAAIVRLCVIYKKSANPFSCGSANSPTARECEKFLQDNPEVRDVANYVTSSSWIKKFMTPAVAGFCMFSFDQVDPDNSNKFFEQLKTGVFESETSPVLLLRDRLMEDKSGKDRMTKRYLTAIVFKAFRIFRSGQTVRFLRIRETGPGVEKDLFKI